MAARLLATQAAAVRVVAARMAQFAAAPSAAQALIHPDMTVMLTEKVGAGTAAAMAMMPLAARPLTIQARWFAGAADLWWRCLASPPARWPGLTRDLATLNAAHGSAMLALGTELGHATLTPIWRAVMANDRRFRRG